MSDYMKSKLGWWPVIVLAALGYALPVYLIGLHFGPVAGIIAFLVPPYLCFDRVGGLQVMAGLAWFYFAGVAVVSVLGLWLPLVFVPWGIVGMIAVSALDFFNS